MLKMADPCSLLSVIIPTYNRKESLLTTLDSLCQQTWPARKFEVVVVDDGGSDGTGQVAQATFPFRLVYLSQTNQGSAAARNHGALQSSGDILVFIDDDVTLHPGYLAEIAPKVVAGTIAMGAWQPYEPSHLSHFGRANARRITAHAAHHSHDEQVPFTECTSNNLGVHRSDFDDVGMWRDVLGDGPTLWGDVEFGYRAWRKGCHFLRVAGAKLIHRDQHMTSLESATKRAYHVSKAVLTLFTLHPGIEEHLAMFHDKGPIAWRQDSLALIARKLLRQAISAPLPRRGLEWLVRLLEVRWPSPAILERLYRWIISAYIYRGYRDGLREASRGMS